MIIVYCDGSCPRNGSVDASGGWNFLIVEGDKNDLTSQKIIHTESGYSPPDQELPNTNIRMELMAVISALKYFKDPKKLLVHSDSAYVVNGVNKQWYLNWFRTGKNTLGKVPANLDLWVNLVDEVNRHDSVVMVHVKGHAGHKWQEMSDVFARQASTGGVSSAY